MAIAVIPCRSGSKRVLNKNRQKVGRYELWEKAVDDAVATEFFDKVVLATDDKDLLASKYVGVTVYERPQGDDGPMHELLLRVCDAVLTDDDEFSIVTLAQPTSPFREPQDLIDCADMAMNGAGDSVVSMVATDSGYRRNGAVYVTRPWILRTGLVIGGHVGFYVMPPDRSIDINTPEDLEEARRIWKEKYG